MSNNFTIHDAFEEENDEAIRVYGSTVISTPIRNKRDDVRISVKDSRDRFAFRQLLIHRY